MTLWTYEDARGNQHIGKMERYVDFGGTDHTAYMRDIGTNELSLVSGSRLRAMQVMRETASN